MKKIVLTGGPCAGKTTLTQVLSKIFSNQIAVVPETASLLFSGGFPRWEEPESLRATQRAIYRVQVEIEAAYHVHYPERTLILDRATLDGAAYWPDGESDYFDKMQTTLDEELKRYDLVMYLESANKQDYLRHQKDNLARTETWEQAIALDRKTRELWKQHSHFHLIQNSRSFEDKIAEAIAVINEHLK